MFQQQTIHVDSQRVSLYDATEEGDETEINSTCQTSILSVIGDVQTPHIAP